ncbi:MAG: hypothetical protein ACRD2Q_03615 [Terriglobales bacterium]
MSEAAVVEALAVWNSLRATIMIIAGMAVLSTWRLLSKDSDGIDLPKLQVLLVKGTAPISVGGFRLLYRFHFGAALLLFLISASLYLAVAIGLWHFRHWARILSVGLAGIETVLLLYAIGRVTIKTFVPLRSASLIVSALSVLLNGFTILFMLRPSVMRVFGAG